MHSRLQIDKDLTPYPPAFYVAENKNLFFPPPMVVLMVASHFGEVLHSVTFAMVARAANYVGSQPQCSCMFETPVMLSFLTSE